MRQVLINYINEGSHIKDQIKNYPLTISNGTKKVISEYANFAKNERNNCVQELLSKYKDDEEKIKAIIDRKVANLRPINENVEIKTIIDKNKVIKKLFKYTNVYNETYDKTKLSKIVYDLDSMEKNNLSSINQIIGYVLDKFSKSNITLSSDDFNYSLYSKQYLTLFTSSLGKEDFDDIMEKEFNDIYWKCPNILTHIKLNIRYLAKKYEKELSKFIEQRKKELFVETNTTSESYKSIYNENTKRLNYLIRIDDYRNVEKFLTKKLAIDDYIETSPVRTAKLNKYLKTKKFDELTNDEKEKYFANVIDLSNTLSEIININKFNAIILDIKKRYSNIEKNKGLLKTKEKEIEKLEQIRIKQVKQSSAKVGLFKKKDLPETKLNEILASIDESVKNLNKAYRELDDIRVNEQLSKTINKGSSIYDAIEFANSFYGYLKNTIVKEYDLVDISQVEKLMNSINDFIKDSNNNTTKDLNLFQENDFKNLIKNKCLLLDIDIDESELDDFEGIKSNLDIITNIYYLDKLNITLNDIKFIYDVDNEK